MVGAVASALWERPFEDVVTTLSLRPNAVFGGTTSAARIFAISMESPFGAAFGQTPTVPIQAGVSALLVILMGPQAAGLPRYLDVLVGGMIGLAFAIVFFRARLNFKD